MIKAIIVDDEPQGRRLLKSLIEEHCPDVHILEVAEDLPNAVKLIRKLKPELVFLDIEMPGHSGLEIADFFGTEEMDFSIIFTTAYADYAIHGYKLDAVDYLLKPIDSTELVHAVARYNAKKSKHTTEKIATQTPTTISVPVGQNVKFFELENITFFKALNTYTKIHFIDSSKIVVSRTLKNFEDALEAFHQFVRCHKSYIVNKKYVVDYVKSEGGSLILKNGIEIPVTAEKVQEFLNGSIFIKR